MARLALKPGNILLLSKVLSLRDSAFTPVSNTHVCVWGGHIHTIAHLWIRSLQRTAHVLLSCLAFPLSEAFQCLGLRDLSIWNQ